MFTKCLKKYFDIPNTCKNDSDLLIYYVEWIYIFWWSGWNKFWLTNCINDLYLQILCVINMYN